MDPYDGVVGVFTAIWHRYEQVGFSNLVEPEKVIFCTWQFVSEVNNGGFRQYFFNDSGEFATESVGALQAVRMPFAASLLRRALTVFPSQMVPRIRDARITALKQLPDEIQVTLFNELSRHFFASSEDPYALQWNYITRHRRDLPDSIRR